MRTTGDGKGVVTLLIRQLAMGEAIVTVLNEKGAPTPVAWTRLRAPSR